jgi:hypothetical protein
MQRAIEDAPVEKQRLEMRSRKLHVSFQLRELLEHTTQSSTPADSRPEPIIVPSKPYHKDCGTIDG